MPACGSEIFFSQAGGRFSAAVRTEQGFDNDPPQLMFEAARGRVFGMTVPSGDAQRFIIGTREQESLAALAGGAPSAGITVVLNWFEELKQRVPTGGQ